MQYRGWRMQCFAGWLAFCFAATGQCDPEVERLLGEGAYREAYQRGLTLQAAHEGDPAFDLVFGRAALLAGRTAEAIFALERVSITEPGNVEARIFLARAFLHMKELNAAERELNEALARSADPGQQARARALLVEVSRARSPRQERLDAWLDVSMGHDSNVNDGASSSRFSPQRPGYFGPPNIPLVPDLRPQSAWFHREAMGGIYYRPLGDHSALDLFALVARRQNLGEDTFDRGEIKIDVGYLVERRADRFRFGFRYLQDDLDDDRFRYSWGPTFDYLFDGRFRIDRGWEHRLSAALTKVEYPTGINGRFRDVNQWLLGLTSHGKIGRFDHRLQGTLVYEQANESRSAHNARRLGSIDWRVRYLDLVSLAPALEGVLPGAGDVSSLLARVTPYAGFSYVHARHNRELISAGKVREDRAAAWQFGLRWQYRPALAFRAEVAGNSVDSNVSLYESRGDVFLLGMRYQFQ